ncbi:hypothetical protein NYZ99_18130 [Maribacter litopenaei]|uniref:DUF4258 domain-containing protein n=1 Tax=Maribacter litopenaei TaxID=2976127 RepID=A0ABY5Y8N9_9FLAO|nr:hypothetical protein [Maribacter litopenaei]UWX54722.1 hypothetical protein NYZ99_18130 [Maribacter litopenaei]
MKKYLLFALVVFGMVLNVHAKANQMNQVSSKEIINDDYERIPSSELTPAVVEEILKEYPTSKLGAAYRNSKGIFKLVMVLKSGTRRTVYIDPYGNWITNKKR